MSEWIQIILAVIGGGTLTTLLFYPQTRKQKRIENETKQSEEWKKLYMESQEQCSAKQAKIERMYADFGLKAAADLEAQKEHAKISVENAGLRILKCEVPGCPKRDPATGY